ncbi:MAG: serine peptidase, partial [Burkholderiaceae bacterium]
MMLKHVSHGLRAVLAAAVFGPFLLGFAGAPAVAQVRALPDFTDLVEQVGPSVVNIRTLEKIAARPRSGGGNMDDEMLEFF